MSKLMTIALGATLAVSLATPASAQPWRNDECRYQFVDHHRNWSKEEVKLTIRCAAHKFGVSVGKALHIADRESSFYQFAKNPYSSAAGIYQHIQSYWYGRVRSFIQAVPKYRPIGTSVFNARSNVMVSLHMARSSWSPWGG
jgi:hypothetical protein